MLQIAAHVSLVPEPELQAICAHVRAALAPEHAVGQQDERIAAVEQLPHPFRQRRRPRRGLIELAVEGVQQPPDRLGVGTAGEANFA